MDFWREHRPDIYASFLQNAGAMMDEERIELIHAWIAQHSVVVQMARADTLQASTAFLSRGPMSILQDVFAQMAHQTPDSNVSDDGHSLMQDAGALREALLQMLGQMEKAANEDMRSTRQGVDGVVYDPTIGPITRLMLAPIDVDAIIDSTTKSLCADLSRHTTCKQLHEILCDVTRP